MTVNTKAMVGVPVFTRSGSRLGRVGSFDFDPATGRLTGMRVKTRGLVPGLMADELAVAWDAIVEIRAEKVVVLDGAVPAASKALAGSATVPNPSLMKEG